MRERPAAAQRGGESMATMSGPHSVSSCATSSGPLREPTTMGIALVVHQDEVEPLADPDVDPQ